MPVIIHPYIGALMTITVEIAFQYKSFFSLSGNINISANDLSENWFLWKLIAEFVHVSSLSFHAGLIFRI